LIAPQRRIKAGRVALNFRLYSIKTDRYLVGTYCALLFLSVRFCEKPTTNKRHHNSKTQFYNYTGNEARDTTVHSSWIGGFFFALHLPWLSAAQQVKTAKTVKTTRSNRCNNNGSW
jgi:hypothetical protein